MSYPFPSLEVSDVDWSDKAIANFFTPLSQKKPEQITWRIVNHSLLVGKYSPEESSGQHITGNVRKRRIAAFDLVCCVCFIKEAHSVIDVSTGPHVDRDGVRKSIPEG